MLKFGVASIALAVSASVMAQQPAALAPVAASSQAVLRSGTALSLRTAENLTTETKALKVGQRFNLEVAEPVKINDVVVVPAGARAIGEVTNVRFKGMWGKSGGINARMVSLQVGDRSIRISGSIDDKGKTGTGGVIASVALIPLAGFFVTGTSAKIPSGTFVSAFIDEDVPLAMAAAAQKPLEVTVPAAAVTPAVITASTTATPNAAAIPVALPAK